MRCVERLRQHRATGVLVVVVLLLAGCGPDRPKQVVHVTQYNNGEGVPLYVSGDATKLTGAPKDFQLFMRLLVRNAIESDDGSCNEPPVYTVRTITDTGFAGGDISQCGIEHLVWTRTSGHWMQVLTYTSDPRCSDLKAHRVPAGVTGDNCRDDGGLRPYRL